MLYRILRFLFGLTVKGYFRSIYVKGKEYIPSTGPVIFAPNHPSAFMDPILLSTEISRTLFFLAKGDIFKKQLAASFFNLINMIPVYRNHESPDDVHKNDMIFQKCFEHLAKGKPIMIFPEGSSKTERKLRTIKTGTARIALGAEALNGFKLGVKIIPVGINYSNPHNFRSDVFVNFGEPIEVSEYEALYIKDDREAVTVLTDRIKLEIEKLFVIVQDEGLEKLIRQIEKLYRSKLRENTGPSEKAVKDFYISKDIVMAVDYHLKNHPEKLEAFQTNIHSYMNGLKELNIRDTQVRASGVNLDVVRSILFFMAAFPLFLYGYVTNYLPYKLAEFVSGSVPVRDDFVGSIKIATGMFIFLIVYLIEAVVFSLISNVWLSIVFVLSLYPAGVFALSYIRKYLQLAGTINYLRLFMSKSDLVAKLKYTRQELIDELEAGKEEYLMAKS